MVFQYSEKNYDENLDSLIRDYGESFDTTYTVGSTIYRKHFQGKYFKSEHRDTCISEKSLATGTIKLTIKFAKSPRNHTVCKENRVLLDSSATLRRLKVTKECKATFPRIDTYIYLEDGTLYAATRNFEGAEKSVLVLGSDSKNEIENNRKRCYAALREICMRIDPEHFKERGEILKLHDKQPAFFRLGKTQGTKDWIQIVPQ